MNITSGNLENIFCLFFLPVSNEKLLSIKHNLQYYEYNIIKISNNLCFCDAWTNNVFQVILTSMTQNAWAISLNERNCRTEVSSGGHHGESQGKSDCIMSRDYMTTSNDLSSIKTFLALFFFLLSTPPFLRSVGNADAKWRGPPADSQKGREYLTLKSNFNHWSISWVEHFNCYKEKKFEISTESLMVYYVVELVSRKSHGIGQRLPQKTGANHPATIFKLPRGGKIIYLCYCVRGMKELRLWQHHERKRSELKNKLEGLLFPKEKVQNERVSGQWRLF